MDKVALVKAEVQGEEWAARIQACRESGMSVRSWCRENGIASKTYYYHLRKLREKLCEQIPVAVAAVPESNESVMRISVVGRKNWLFSDSPKGAEASAIVYSLAATAAANGIPVEQYFTDLLRHPQNPPMPWN